MAQSTLTTLDGLLKTLYPNRKPKDTTYKGSPFAAMVRKEEDFFGKNLAIPVIYGENAARSSTFATAQTASTTAQTMADEFLLTRVADYSIATITGEAIMAAKTDKGAFVRGLEFMIDRAFQAIQRSMHIKSFRSSGGSRGVVGSISTTDLTLANIQDVVNFEEGMVIQGDTVDGGGTVHTGTATIASINRATGVLTATANWTTGISSLAADDFLFANGDYGLAPSGVLGWIPADAPGATAFFGVDRTDSSRLGGVRYDGSSDAIDEALVELLALVQREGGDPDAIFLSNNKWKDMAKALQPAVRYVDVGKGSAKVSFPGFEIFGPNGSPVMVYADRNCPDAYGLALQMDTWGCYSAGPANQILMHDGLRVQRQATADGVEVRIGGYYNYGCNAPGFNGIVTLPAS